MSGGIAEIRVRNYQSLRKADIKLGLITAIVGPTDSGKSAFFRAVKAVVENQDGTEFITAGEKKTVVTVDGVAWIQSEKDNEYRIGDKVWQRVGRGVPDEVRAELGMGMQEFGKDVKVLLNFSGQLDRAFLVEGNPADSAKIVGAISNVHKIYNGLREAEKDAKATKRDMTERTGRLEALRAELLSSADELARYATTANALNEVFEKAKQIERQMEAVYNAAQWMAKTGVTLEAERSAVKRLEGLDIEAGLEMIQEAIALDMGLNALKVNAAQGLSARQSTRAVEAVDCEAGMRTLESVTVIQGANKKLMLINGEIADRRGEVAEDDKSASSLRKAMDAIPACEVCGAEKKDWRLNV